MSFPRDWTKHRRLIPLLLGAVATLFSATMMFADVPTTEPAQVPAAADVSPAADPTGATVGSSSDIPVSDPKAGMTINDVAAVAAHSKFAINMIWTLITGFCVMYMQAGFALVETGLCRAKNASHTMAMNFMIYPLAMMGFYICGFAFMFGKIGAISTMGNYAGLNSGLTIRILSHDMTFLGTTGFCLQGHYDTAVFALFLFQLVFMDTAATIPTGSCAERWKFIAFCLYGCAVGSILYPVYGCWVWGGGWLSALGSNFNLGHGVVDFAGSSVVHFQGGAIAMVGAWFIGPRIGKYNRDGSLNALPAHNIPMVILGTFILAFCWFSFNAGSSLSGSDMRIAICAVNTMLASATATLATTIYMWAFRTGKPDPTMMCNGMLAGLVAITAPCAFVNSASACLIGLIAGILVVESVLFFDRVARIDDPVGAISVHGVNGAWGLLSVGIFADGTYGNGYNNVAGGVRGLLYGGGVGQLVAGVIGLIACCAYLMPATFVVFFIIQKLVGHRPLAEIEVDGVDLHEMGVPGYSGYVMDKASESPITK